MSTGDTAGDIILPGARSWTDLDANVLFEKVLTSSDINPQGRIVVPKVVTSLLSDTVCSVLDAPWQAIYLQAKLQSHAIIYLYLSGCHMVFTFQTNLYTVTYVLNMSLSMQRCLDAGKC